jgi:tRNA/rRNA methyltransferase
LRNSNAAFVPLSATTDPRNTAEPHRAARVVHGELRRAVRVVHSEPACPVRVVLVRPVRGSNVGAVCRAIKNMGAGSLHVVGGAFDPDHARRTAVHAHDVWEARTVAPSLTDALAGCSLVVGTTARGGAYRERGRDIRDIAAQIAAAECTPDGLGPALVFGPEDSGLSNEEIAACHRLAYIPTSADYASLNLAQAAVVCLYEVLRSRVLSSAAAGPNPAPGDRGRADAAAVEDMYAALERALLAIGFLSPQNPAHVMMTLRDVLGRAGLDERELRILRGVARQISWFADGGDDIARAKRERGEKLK